MANKKQNKGNNKILFLLLASGAVILIILLLVSLFKINRVIVKINNEAPNLVIVEVPRSFEILSVGQDSYAVRDMKNNEEAVVLVPKSAQVELLSGAAARAGDILVLQKYVMAFNGLIAHELQILPPAPRDLPNANLSEKPNE